ncbi:MAG: glutathione peroxidase [Planctomycetota bacterium]
MMKNVWMNVWVCAVAILGSSVLANESEKAGKDKEVTAHSFKMKSLEGKEVDLSKYKGKVVLAVNVASRCGYTPQYEGLQALHEEMKDKGLAVVGFPCNQFGKQEPGSSKQIAQFCSTEFGVTFDMFEKIDVNGDDACDLYKYLTEQESKPKGKGNVRWNFEKFLIGKDGQVVARFGSGTAPDDKELTSAIEKALAAK